MATSRSRSNTRTSVTASVGATTSTATRERARSPTPDYDPPFRFDGRIHRVIVDVSGEHVEDYEAQMRIALAKQ
jgi:hypothetical protein